MISEEENNKINNVLKLLTELKEIVQSQDIVDIINETINAITQYRYEKEG